jgi:hypothetical protein
MQAAGGFDDDSVRRKYDLQSGAPHGVVWTIESLFTSRHDHKVTARIRASVAPFVKRYVRVDCLILENSTT